MSCRIDQYSVYEQFNAEKDVCQHGRSRTNLSREGKCIKFQFSVYLIYQRLARKVAVADDELHEDKEQAQVQEREQTILLGP